MNIRSIMPVEGQLLRIEAIVDAVASVWGIEPEIIFGRSRRQPIAFARQLCMDLAYKKTHLSLCQVGDCFDNRDHTTVVYAIKKVDQASVNKDIKPLIKEVMMKLKPNA